MAHVDSGGTASIVVNDVPEGPPMKKLKQGRLPFKPLDPSSSSLLSGTTNNSTKKRKLSDSESPSAKQLKTVPVKTSSKPAIDGEHEVSSSSEAEVSPFIGHHKGAKPRVTLDCFFKKKLESSQPEVSSTNECGATIDLTEEVVACAEKQEVDGKDKKPDEIDASNKNGETTDMETDVCTDLKKSDSSESKIVNKQTVECQSSQSLKKPEGILKFAVKIPESKTDEGGRDGKGESKTDEDKDAVVEDGGKSTGDGGKSAGDNKENVDAEQEDRHQESDVLEVSFVEDVSVCENALKTPDKNRGPVSVLKTPLTATVKSGSAATPSSSDTTPISSLKKKKPLSEKKKQEREAREKEREEKRLQREKEKQEKEQDRQEKLRKRNEEKVEKEKQKQEEKERREKERLEKLQQKEEEKKQKEKELQSKLEERKKKEEERKLKEEEKRMKDEEKQKEEEEKLKKAEKKKEMFKGFFIQKTPSASPPKVKEAKNSFFMPFEVKPNMKVAPSQRAACLSGDRSAALDDLLSAQNTEKLYLNNLKSGAYNVGRSPATWIRTPTDKDVEIISHEKETIEKVTHQVKFLHFHENTRPPYYGTWRKYSHKLSARNPFRQDEALFDYEVDSDDEWEEEEPGESVSSDENDDDEEKEEKGEVDEEEEGDGWMVPHGYLSDGEGIEDEEEEVGNKQDLQKVRQAAWESELKRQAKPLRMIAVGPVWHDRTTDIAAQQLETLLKYKAVCLMEGPILTSYTRDQLTELETQPTKRERAEGVKSKLKPKSVPEEAMVDLIQLVHGNPWGVKNLVKEFRMFWKLKTNSDSGEVTALSDKITPSGEVTSLSDKTTPSGEVTPTSGRMTPSGEVTPASGRSTPTVEGTAAASTPEPSTPGDKSADSQDVEMTMEIDNGTPKDATSPKTPSDAKLDDFTISKRQLEIKIPSIAVYEKRPEQFRKRLWYVNQDVLQQYNLEHLTLPNRWKYVCVKEPAWAREKVTPKVEKTTLKVEEPVTNTPAPSVSGRATPNIMQFAQPMSPSMIQAISQAAAKKEALIIEENIKNQAVNTATSKQAINTGTSQEHSESTVVVKSVLPKDQKTIKDMFFSSPVSRKKPILSGEKPAVDCEIVSCSALPQKDKMAVPVSAVPVSSTPDIEKKEIEETNDMAAPSAALSTPKNKTCATVSSMLTSPELMKRSSQSGRSDCTVVGSAIQKVSGRSDCTVVGSAIQMVSTEVESHQVMEVDDDVICLD